MINKKLIFGMVFLMGVLLIGFISAGFSQSSFQSSSPNSFGYLSRQGINLESNFDQDMCQKRTDFVVQIAPFGCEPAVVRSDLLEEQNVPVFCQLSATQINPLIDVQAIDTISFKGDYPDQVSGTGFHPARAALKSTRSNLLNSPVLENIGYVVIVLEQNKDESSMPDYVEGTLTANIKYDIQNAFGIGKANYYLPELSDTDWERSYARYGFWSGKGYVRAEGIDEDGATISIYSDVDKRLSAFDLNVGETSSDIFVPGLYCLAGLNVRLDSLQNPGRTVILNVNGQIYEVGEKEKFLDNRCVVKEITKRGLFRKVEGECNTDEKRGEDFELIISPKVNLKIDNDIATTYEVGDYLYEDQEITAGNRYVYLGYSGSEKGSEKVEDSYIILFKKAEKTEELSIDEINSLAWFADSSESSDITQGLSKLLEDSSRAVVGASYGLSKYLLKGDSYRAVKYGEIAEETIGKSVEFVSIAGPENKDFSELFDNDILENVKKEYDNAVADYRKIVDSYSSVKIDENDFETLGEKALYSLIILTGEAGQGRTMGELCKEFKEKFPNAKKTVSGCNNEFKMASLGSSATSFFIDGRIKELSLDDVYIPTKDDYGAEIQIRNAEGITETIILSKDEKLSLGTLFGTGSSNEENKVFWYKDTEQITGMVDRTQDGILTREYETSFTYYFRFNTLKYSPGAWEYNQDKEKANDWKSCSEGDKKPTICSELVNENFKKGEEIFESNFDTALSTQSNEYIQLVDLDKDYAKLNVYTYPQGTFETAKVVLGATKRETLRKGVSDNFGGNYVFTLTKINLKKKAKITILPNVNNAGTEANFSFKIGIEKRAIQLSPTKIKNKIEDLDKSIKQWEGISENLGSVVKGLKGACLGVGTILTVKNFFGDLGGKSIARQQVMQSSGGWNDFCKKEIAKKDSPYNSLDHCLLENSDKIDSDVAKVEQFISEQEGVTEENVDEKLIELGGSLGNTIVNPNNAEEKIIVGDGLNLGFVSGSYENNYATLEQVRDLERLNKIIGDGSISETLKNSSKAEKYTILKDIETNVNAKKEFNNLKQLAANNKFGIGVSSYGDKDSIKGAVYDGGKIYGREIKGIVSEEDKKRYNLIENKEYNVHIAGYGRERYFFILEDNKNNNYLVSQVARFIEFTKDDKGVKNGVRVEALSEDKEGDAKDKFTSFIKYDRTSYQNKFEEAFREVRYFESEPYKGLASLVPFDTEDGWYASVTQTLSGSGNIQSYDGSGRVSSFELCNVGRNGKPESDNLKQGDDICRTFNPGTGEIYGEFPGMMNPSDTKKVVSRAVGAVEQASKQYKKGIKQVKIWGEKIRVGNPAANVPSMQCQNFMSPKDCWLLFNVCDPVICPTSRCNLGGTYYVEDVIQSGIIGSVALCLPNFKEKIFIPVCLTGIKAGIDGLLSVFKNYRDCLQHSLDTGEQIGVCDEIHSIYLCEFMWRQALPLTKLAIPKLLEFIMGEGERGGGEYLNIQSAWANAENSVDYLVSNYGKNSLEAFKLRTADDVGTALCKSFVSAKYPASADFFDSLLEPDSPVQYQAHFSEIPFTTATVPATSQYKVFYHIYAGQDAGTYYSVYLKGSEGSSFYEESSPRTVATGYIGKGEYASETKDFTAVANYKELCVNVNGQVECGFGKVTSSFAIDYVADKYAEQQASETKIKTKKECISGSSSAYSLLNPNLQEGVDDAINPSLYKQGIVRICSTDNPGLGTDVQAENNLSRWRDVGYCSDEGLRCWLDVESVKDVVNSISIEKDILGEVTDEYVKKLMAEGNYFPSPGDTIAELEKKNAGEIVGVVTDSYLAKFLLNNHKAYVLFLRGNAYRDLVFEKLGMKSEGLPDNPSLPTKDELEEEGTGTDEGEEGNIYEGFSEKEKKVIENAETCDDCGNGWVTNSCDEKECRAIGGVLSSKGKSDCVFNQNNKCVESNKGSVIYVNSNAKRNLKLNPELENIILMASKKIGLPVEIFSGGQKEGVSNGVVGSHRHDEGYAADIWIYSNEEKQQKIEVHKGEDITLKFIQALIDAGATSIGVGKNYMGGVGIHVDIAQGNSVAQSAATYWGDEGESVNAPSWLKNMFEGNIVGGNENVIERDIDKMEKVLEITKVKVFETRKCLCGDSCGDYAKWIVEYSNEYGNPDPLLILSLAMQEGNCNYPKCKEDGAQWSCGLMQVNKNYFDSKNGDPASSEDGIKIGIQFLYEEKYNLVKDLNLNCYDHKSNWEKAVHAYNGWGCDNLWYIQDVKKRYEELEKEYNNLV